MNTLDKLGIPGLMVATSDFVPAAAAQSKSLGFEPNIIWLPYQIQNRTEAELKDIAYDAFSPIYETLKGNA